MVTARYKFALALYLLVCFFSTVSVGVGASSETDDSSEEDDEVTCSAYCDEYGYYQPGHTCTPTNNETIYCCGDEHRRFCCNDSNDDAGDYDPVDSCPNSSWWYFQWRVIVGMLVALIVLLATVACCYYCCGDPRSQGQIWRRNRRNRNQAQTAEVNTVTGQVGDSDVLEYGHSAPTFDPESPYAFMPPAYESLPKDPPIYSEIYANPAFEGDASGDGELEPPLQGASGAENSDAVDECPTGSPENPRLEPTAPRSPPPAYEERDDTRRGLPPVSINDDGSVADSSAESSGSGSRNSQGEDRTTPSTSSSSVSVVTVSSVGHSDVDGNQADGAAIDVDSSTPSNPTRSPAALQERDSDSNTLADSGHCGSR